MTTKFIREIFSIWKIGYLKQPIWPNSAKTGKSRKTPWLKNPPNIAFKLWQMSLKTVSYMVHRTCYRWN